MDLNHSLGSGQSLVQHQIPCSPMLSPAAYTRRPSFLPRLGLPSRHDEISDRNAANNAMGPDSWLHDRDHRAVRNNSVDNSNRSSARASPIHNSGSSTLTTPSTAQSQLPLYGSGQDQTTHRTDSLSSSTQLFLGGSVFSQQQQQQQQQNHHQQSQFPAPSLSSRGSLDQGCPPQSTLPYLPSIITTAQHPPTPPMNSSRSDLGSGHAAGHQYPLSDQYVNPSQQSTHHGHHGTQQQQQQHHQSHHGHLPPPHHLQQQSGGEVEYNDHNAAHHLHQPVEVPYETPSRRHDTQVPFGYHQQQQPAQYEQHGQQQPPTPPMGPSSSQLMNTLLPPPVAQTTQPQYPQQSPFGQPTALLPLPTAQPPYTHQSPHHAVLGGSYSHSAAPPPNGDGSHSPTSHLLFQQPVSPTAGRSRSMYMDRVHHHHASGSGLGATGRSHRSPHISTLGSNLRPNHHQMGIMRPSPPSIAAAAAATHYMNSMYPSWYPPFNPRRGATHDRPYSCGTCATAFSRNHDLKRHEKIHLDVKPHACVCSRRFSRKDALKRHQLVKACKPESDGHRNSGSDDDHDKDGPQSGPYGQPHMM